MCLFYCDKLGNNNYSPWEITNRKVLPRQLFICYKCCNITQLHKVVDILFLLSVIQWNLMFQKFDVFVGLNIDTIFTQFNRGRGGGVIDPMKGISLLPARALKIVMWTLRDHVNTQGSCEDLVITWTLGNHVNTRESREHLGITWTLRNNMNTRESCEHSGIMWILGDHVNPWGLCDWRYSLVTCPCHFCINTDQRV